MLRETVYSVPILDFWGPMPNSVWGGWNAFVHVSLRLESRSWKELQKSYIFHNSVRFQKNKKKTSIFLSARDCTTFT